MSAQTKHNESLKSPETQQDMEKLLAEVTTLENLAATLNIPGGAELLKTALSKSPDIKSKD